MKIHTPFSQRRGKFATLLSALFLLLAAFVLSGCADDNTDNSTDNSDTDGELVIGLTDAEGDFATYTVDVKSLTLTKASGEVVHTLPLSTRVDFAQYTEMTEFLTVATISSGLYVQAEMVLDYSDADIRVEDANGDAVQVDTIVDADGNPLTELTMAVKLEGQNSLRIVPGVPAHLTLDFDLKASNSVEFSPDPIVTVEPFLLAELDVEKFKTHRLRGPLANVDVANNTFDVIIRPFHRHMSRHDIARHFGTITVTATNNTVYEVDGESYQGNAGLTAMEALPRFSATLVRGDIKLNPRRFVAHEVYAGSSVPGGSDDVITGNVIDRTGNTLTVKGVTLIRTDGSVVFNDNVTVQLSRDTIVKRQLSMGADYDIDDISVGQRLRIFGTLASRLEMKAKRVQMRFTTLRGTVVGMGVIPVEPIPVTPFVVDLQAIDGRRVSLFDFSGTGQSSTGTDATNDANPAAYEIVTSSLDVSGFSDGAPVKVRGFVTPFGSAPADFTAHSVFDVALMKGVMAISWEPASGTAIPSLAADGMRLNLEGVGRFHHVSRGRVAIDLTTLTVPPSIVPRADGKGLYLINQAGRHQLHTTFARFADDLNTRLSDGARVRHLAASGPFDNTTAQMTSGFVKISVK
ncbi:MAG: metallophosphoesterase [Gammaproteobacteria bacterium]|nr:metallophosphoesterase [Gammaproteobacteria bacterium]MCF6361974.1 metallophosphoesterase [Gammaproteobacteria bacterium]